MNEILNVNISALRLTYHDVQLCIFLTLIYAGFLNYYDIIICSWTILHYYIIILYALLYAILYYMSTRGLLL